MTRVKRALTTRYAYNRINSCTSWGIEMGDASSEPGTVTSLRVTGSYLLALIRVIWILLAVGGVVQVFIILSFMYEQYRSPPMVLAQSSISPQVFFSYFSVLTVVSLVVFYGVSAFMIWRRKNDRIGILVAVFLVALGSSWMGGYGPIMLWTLPLDSPLLWLLGSMLGTVAWGGLLLFPALFPDGRIVPHWARYLIIYYVITAVASNTIPVDSQFFPYNWPRPLFLLLFVTVWGSALYIQVYRYRHFSSPSQRQQTKWVVFGYSVSGLLLLTA
ncbi:MAG: hypothetical protein L0154_26780, partial [Chloroflexi bacterium]|nr:hypothetical protein [Chloroflexota bacterium]